MEMNQILPGSTIGVLGAGQLGRMFAFAAQKMGYRVVFFCPDRTSCAFNVTDRVVVGKYNNRYDLGRFASMVDVITFEFENIPPSTLKFLEERKPVRPSRRVLQVTNDRLREKVLMVKLGIPVAYFDDVAGSFDARPFRALPVVVKTRKLGYDGKGQVRIKAATRQKILNARRTLNNKPCIVESLLDFDFELSVIVARGLDGKMVTYPPVQNEHQGGILLHTYYYGASQLCKLIPPIKCYQISDAMNKEAREIAEAIAKELKLQGIMAVEMFAKDEKLFVNELAPRPHNSGHWTIDACQCSQFEQHVRAICGLPLKPTFPHSKARMVNLIGTINDAEEAYKEPNASVHIYGKEPRPGRKLGHITYLYPH